MQHESVALRDTAQAGGLGPSPGGDSAVVREVWWALRAAGHPVTVRELAAATGVRRDSVARVLRMLERVDRASREHGDGRRGIGDLWSVGMTSADCDAVRSDEEVAGRMAGGRGPGARAAMRAARAPSRAGTEEGNRRCPTCGTGEQAPRRLAKGELEELLLRTLRARRGESFGVVALSRMSGGHSQGAVANACERLTRRGALRMIYGRGREYSAVE